MKVTKKLQEIIDSSARTIKNDLKRLNKLSSNLGDQAADYVIHGTNETVLATLSAKGGDTEIEVTGYASKVYTRERHRLLARMSPYDPEIATRYAQVIHAVVSSFPQDLAGSKETPEIIRLYFSQLFMGIPNESNIWPPKKMKCSVQPEIALDMIRRLGGTSADYFDVVYNELNYWYGSSSDNYRKIIDLKDSVSSNTTAVIEAAKRINVAGRVYIIEDLKKWNLISPEPFLSFIIGLAGDGSKTVREAAISALKSVPNETIEPLAAEQLSKGSVNTRAGMVEVLKLCNSQSALNTLQEHRKIEKTARIQAAIDTLLAIDSFKNSENSDTDDENSYLAIDGTTVEIPPLKPLETGTIPEFTGEDKNELLELIRRKNEEIKKLNEENKKQKYSYTIPLTKENIASKAISLLNNITTIKENKINHHDFNYFNHGKGESWMLKMLSRFPMDTKLQVAIKLAGGANNIGSIYTYGIYNKVINEYARSQDGDLRHLDRLEVELEITKRFGNWRNRREFKAKKGDLLRDFIPEDYYYFSDPELMPQQALWPYIADNFEVMDEALGLKSDGPQKLNRIAAIKFLTVLPKPPKRYIIPLLEVATGTTKSGRKEARKMLNDAPEIEERLVALLDDSRQAIRAGAAEWLAERKDPSAVKALKKRLKKEKSDLAKASILTALSSLGEDLSNFIGPKALEEEAEKVLKKAKFDKLDWLKLEHLPTLKYAKKGTVPTEVLKAWIYLAFKFKQPGGNKLFDLYLDQLRPEDAEKFSTWILDSWINYDTMTPSQEEANAHAKAHYKNHYNMMKKWYEGYTEEQAIAELKSAMLSNYLNSGAATKGILGFAGRVPSAIAAGRVSSYLKNHGTRTSQASSLLEVLAHMGDPVALQVVIAAATRLKQKSVQKFSGELLQKVADEKGWTLDELADRTIPVAGFNDNGLLELQSGEKTYQAVIDEDLKLLLRNPDGKTVKALPASQDDTTKASKKQLSASKKELKQVVTMQTARLYEALCAGRSWPIEDWKQNFIAHPIMRKIIERIVWLGTDNDDNIISAFRPTAEGDFTNAADDTVELSDFTKVQIAHGTLISEEEAENWGQHIEDYEIKPLFVQFGRTLKTVDKKNAKNFEIDDRKGWVTDTFTIRGIATKLGYERGETMDAGTFNEYTKIFRGAGIAAVIEFSGSYLPEENIPAALVDLKFMKINDQLRRTNPIALGEVPPVLLSECWNDLHTIAEKASYQADWKSKMLW